MSAIYVPSIWDYLAQAGTQGLTSFQQSRDRAEEESRRKRAEAMQGLQMMMSMESQGLVPYQNVNDQLAQMPWLKGAQMTGPSEGGLRAQIANTPDKVPELAIPNVTRTTGTSMAPVTKPSAAPPKMISGIDQYTDAQRSRAGLKTRAQEEAERLQLEAQRLGIEMSKSAEQRSADEYTYNKSMRPVMAIRDVMPVMDAMAVRHVSTYINANKGRLNRNQLSSVAASAYKQFAASADGKAMLQADPTSGVYAQSYFEDAVRKAFLDQEEMDLKQRIAAMQFGSRGMQPNELANALTNAAKNMTDRAQGLRKAAGVAETINNIDPEGFSKLSPAAQGKITNANMLDQQANEFNLLSAGVLAGSATPEYARQKLAAYLQGVDQAPVPQGNPQGTLPPGSIPSMGGKRQVTEDQKQYLLAHNLWDPKKYEVAK